MLDKDTCDAWLKERRQTDDLLKQNGFWSTIILKTKNVSFHIEYRQEEERCKAHNLDVWVSEVNPDVFQNEHWEGIFGETKSANQRVGDGEHINIDRKDALKFADDGDYEVISPFSIKCKACVPR